MPRDEAGIEDRPIRVCGDDCLSVAFDNSAECQSAAEHIRRSDAWLETVAGINTVVVQFDAATISLDAARQSLATTLRSVSTIAGGEAPLMIVPVCYGDEFGPDFAAVCESLGLTADELVRLHTAAEHRVDMLGFTPGFAYVGGLPNELSVPRLAEPRLRVAAGSVGLADGRTGLYAMPGPGGWRLIGRTPMRLFDPASQPPFVLHAGMLVRFKPIGADEFRTLSLQ